MDDLNLDSFSLGEFDDFWDFEEFSFEGTPADASTEDEPGRKQRRIEENRCHVVKLPRPRILKSDFRRSYPQIWAGVFNAANYSTTLNHLSMFFTRDASIVQQDLRLG